MQDAKSNIYCPAIHQGIYIERVNQDSSKVAPCCAAKPQLFSNQEVEFSTNPFLLKLRQENLQSIASVECNECWNKESAGASSLRQSLLEYYNQPRLQTTGLASIDYNVEPICNATCIICSRYHSSAWLAEDQKFDAVATIERTAASSRNNRIIEQLDFSQLKKIYVNGGEPSLSKDLELILEKLYRENRLHEVDVGFNMNGSVMPSNRVIELLHHAHSVSVYFSIDGVGDQFEYTRYPLKWATLLETVAKVAEFPFLTNMAMNVSIGVHNIQFAQEIQDWWYSYTKPWRDRVRILHAFQPVVGPLSLSTVDKKLADYLSMYIETQHCEESWAYFGKQILATANGQNQWMPWLEKLDARRNLNWQQTLPALYDACRYTGIKFAS